MSKQLIFDLPVRPALGREDFFVSPANAAALATVESWDSWPSGKLLVTGTKGAGKTHLVHVWADLAEARVIKARALEPGAVAALAGKKALAIEDLHEIAGVAEAEEALFHLHNLALAEGGKLLFTGRGAAKDWGLKLADLKSRMEGTMSVTLSAPDDALLSAILMKLFSDRQLAVQPSLLPYLLPRMERSFAGAQDLVDALDKSALAEGRAVTRALAAKVLDNQGAKSA